ncbi:MAG: DUF2961 domain-containing protein [Deltaproteobacteria bacterium]|nr:DUF2961 domain-containing protein [Deltaproteobacteria bacterium]
MCLAFATISHAAPLGPDLVNHFERLPEDRGFALGRGVSSYDRFGRNDDGFAGTHSYLYINDADEYVLMDEAGPGCLSRMWFTNLDTSETLRIYLDNGPDPAVEMPLTDFVSGEAAPFLFPLTGDDIVSSGGFYNYVPICFSDHIVVATTGLPHFYNFNYELFADGGVTTYTGAEDLSAGATSWSKAGDTGEIGGEDKMITDAGLTDVEGGESTVLIDETGAGVVRRLRLKFDPVTKDRLERLRLRMTWDGAAHPQVDAPVGLLFASPEAELENQIDTHALPAGIDDEGYYYLDFPMPFWTSARVELENRTFVETEVSFDYDIEPNNLPITAGHFYATENRELTELGRDYTILDAEGRGHYVGVAMTMQGNPLRTYLEGDERVYLNGSDSPAIHGTGCEDYFNGGWYFNQGLFTLPTHGFTAFEWTFDFHRSAVYRMHVSDPVPFLRGIHFGIEHDWNNTRADEDYHSVAFHYGAPDPALYTQAVINLGDPQIERAFDYAIEGESQFLSGQVETYEGDRDDVEVVDYGWALKGASSFNVKINPFNEGLLLRRRMLQHYGGQAARVYVDGELVGLWRTVAQNELHRWRDEEFLIPARFTQGKREIAIRVENANEDVAWTEFVYTIYAYMSLLPSRLDSLAVSASKAAGKIEPGETVALRARGTYWDGTGVDATGLVEWQIDGPDGYIMSYGDFTPAACGDYAVTAELGALTSETFHYEVDCDLGISGPDEDADLAPVGDDDDDDDEGCGF